MWHICSFLAVIYPLVCMYVFVCVSWWFSSVEAVTTSKNPMQKSGTKWLEPFEPCYFVESQSLKKKQQSHRVLRKECNWKELIIHKTFGKPIRVLFLCCLGRAHHAGPWTAAMPTWPCPSCFGPCAARWQQLRCASICCAKPGHVHHQNGYRSRWSEILTKGVL